MSKLLDRDSLLALLPTDEKTAVDAASRLNDFLCPHDSFEAISYEVREGLTRCVTIQADNVDAYVVYFNVDRLRKALTCAAVGLTDNDYFPALAAGVEEIARAEGCEWVHFCTRRRGMVKRAIEYGYEPVSVYIAKKIS
jgi:hypothetical protein